MVTTDNLKKAFAGECQANRKYLAFARHAEKEGLPNIARLFRTTAEAEMLHAEGHLTALGGVGSTAENLGTAIAGETYEYTEMYPPMLERAAADGHPAKRMFGYAVKAEAAQARRGSRRSMHTRWTSAICQPPVSFQLWPASALTITPLPQAR